MGPGQPTCQALNLSDGQRCNEPATANNDIFCRFHAKQCFGMYMGYKRRNVKLDALPNDAPEYLKSSSVPLANMMFEDVRDVSTLQAIHAHLFQEYVLLGRVIDARRLHHKHFYSLQMDYGHQSYLDILANRRHIVLRALERLERRTAEVLYEKEKWFKWVRQVQEDDEANREKEQKKVKLEAAMFKRHWKKIQSRINAQREKEEKQRQDAFLEEAYQERVKAISLEDSDEDDERWDPIEDVVEDERSQYIDLIKHFLWMEQLPEEDPSSSNSAQPNPANEMEQPATENAAKPKKSKKKAKTNATRAAGGSQSQSTQGHAPSRGQNRIMDMIRNGKIETKDTPEPNKNNIETELEMRKRLKEGVEKNYDEVEGPILVGSLQLPHETLLKTAPLADEEIDTLTKDIREIKLLLFCRLLLSHTSLLPAALRASSVEEFLNDPEITKSDLRDLCLKVEQPSLQDIRDACADLGRGDEPDIGEEEIFEVEESIEDVLLQHEKYGHLQGDEWLLKNLDAHLSKELGDEPMHPRRKQRKEEKMKVEVCGKSIWNYSSQASMSRNGWLQFSVLAKDCDLRQAVQLCRNWDEFSQLNFLTTWQYFPASNWVSWGGDSATMQLHELGFFPYFKDLNAHEVSRSHQIGGRSQLRRQHSIVEARNIVVGYMKRNDSVTRRFIQYCTMRTGDILILVRDGRTGKIATSPTNDELWTFREKHGLGRASKKEWDSVLEVGRMYFCMVDILRKWRLGFDDYYDVWIWDFVPGRQPMKLYGDIVHELKRARRVTEMMDLYRPREQFREQAKSLWDEINDPNRVSYYANPQSRKIMKTVDEKSMYKCYTEADAAEDAILFPDELTSTDRNVPFKEISNPLTRFETTSATILQYLAESAKHITKGEGSSRAILDSEHGEHRGESSATTIWSLPRIWEDAVATLNRNHIDPAKQQLLRRIGLLEEGSGLIGNVGRGSDIESKVKQSDNMEIMEKDRGAVMIQSFHAADLEPGAPEKYEEACKIIHGIQAKTQASGSTDWVWFLAELLDWLGVRTDYRTYSHEALAPWPHAFVIQDVVKAFTCMAMFFRESWLCAPATEFFESAEGSKYQDSQLLKPLERSKTVPKHRTRVSSRYRPKSFWKEWDDIFTSAEKRNAWYADEYPLEWDVAIRPIIAKFYRAGIIQPAYLQSHPEMVPGFATAGTEPHRPGELDLFIEFVDRYRVLGDIKFPPNLVHPHEWPDLLPAARRFASKHAGARFAVLRLWTAPHFYPLMIRWNNRRLASFLDPVGRVWEWKYIPKDAFSSEWSIYNTLKLRLDLLREQFGDRVTHRGDVILVMGSDELDLLRYAVAVTFAIQTKPWYREIDLWKSFVNVDLGFLEGLDPYWLD
ncbi:hypothetical protein DL767_003244 [Monosporascus sp. MG133]|nr:hypothetical protein DL767_003244 [Monosporascus sp. MG133]